MATVRLGDVTLDWSETGAGAPVVLIHGSASDTRTWHAQVDALAAGWRVIRYSRRYHWPNEPPGPETAYDMSVHVDDLLRLLEALELPPAHLVGHSYGAYVALMAALKRPAHVASLVLAEPPVVPLLIGNPPRPARLLGLLVTRPRSGWAIARFVATGLGPARAAAREGDLEIALERFGRAVLGDADFEAMSSARREQARVNFFRAELLGERAMLAIDRQAVERLDVPTLLVLGDRSPSLFARLTEHLLALLPAAEAAIVPAASHNMHEANPVAFNALVADFLAARGPAAPAAASAALSPEPGAE